MVHGNRHLLCRPRGRSPRGLHKPVFSPGTYLKACRADMPSFLPSFYRSVHLWAFLQKCTSVGRFTEVYIYGPFYRSVHLWAFLQKYTSMGRFTEVYIYGPFYRSVHLWALLQKCTSVGLLGIFRRANHVNAQT